MFERFTERARQAIVLAQDEARTLGHVEIGTEHLLLGLLREEEGLAARVLADLGVTLAETRAAVAERLGRGEPLETGQMPFQPAAKKVLELSLREALAFRHDYIGTEHVLLGLVREGGGASGILRGRGLDDERVREAVFRRLGGPPVLGAPGASARDPLRSRRSPLTLVTAGWLLGILALGAGILIGWGIWGA